VSFWSNKDHKTGFDDAEELAYAPSGGRLKMWLVGIGVALIPLWYGFRCVQTEHARLWGEHGTDLDVNGSAAIALGIAYMAIGAFIHFHWFWGLNRRLEPLSVLLKLLTLLVFLGSFGHAIYKIVK
jgi:hypothetical protein